MAKELTQYAKMDAYPIVLAYSIYTKWLRVTELNRQLELMRLPRYHFSNPRLFLVVMAGFEPTLASV